MAEQEDAGLPGTQAMFEQLKDVLLNDEFEALLLFDVDELRQVNMQKGIETGDRVIALISSFIAGKGWQGYRTGGDEFGLVLRKADGGVEADRFREALQRLILDKVGVKVQISGGGVRHPGEDFVLDNRMHDLIYATAHQLLLRCKQQERGKIIWLPQAPVESSEVMAMALVFYKELARLNASLAREMELQSRVDFLTGLYNRRGFEDSFERLTQAAQRHKRTVALIYMDSDSLKSINDTQGHEAGDHFIREIARILKEVVRSSDFISRWGADEFAVILDHATHESAMGLAERIRKTVQDRTEGTMSIGVFCGLPKTTEEAVGQADQALYKAKQQGKNRIVFAD